MNNSKLTNSEISLAVRQAIKDRHFSVRACSDAFNLARQDEICSKKIEAMDKDFIQRIRSNKFKVVTERVSNLCDFLGIDINKKPPSIQNVFINEFDVLQKIVLSNPEMEKKLRSLLSNVADVLTLNGAK